MKQNKKVNLILGITGGISGAIILAALVLIIYDAVASNFAAVIKIIALCLAVFGTLTMLITYLIVRFAFGLNNKKVETYLGSKKTIEVSYNETNKNHNAKIFKFIHYYKIEEYGKNKVLINSSIINEDGGYLVKYVNGQRVDKRIKPRHYNWKKRG